MSEFRAVVPTQMQERRYGSGGIYSTDTSRRPHLRQVVHSGLKQNEGYSGRALWKIKLQKEQREKDEAEKAEAGEGEPFIIGDEVKMGSGWKKHSDDMYFHSKLSLFHQESTKRFFEFNASSNQYIEFDPLHEPLEYPVIMYADAVPVKVPNTVVRNVLIKDLAKAGTAMKHSLAHLGSPCALYGLYFGSDEGCAIADAAAKTMHMKLVPRLSQYKGDWDDVRMCTALSGSVDDVNADLVGREGHCSALIALVIGNRVAVGVLGDAQAILGADEIAADLFKDVERPEQQTPLGFCITCCSTVGPSSWLVLCSKTIGELGAEEIATLVRRFRLRPRAAGGAIAATSWEKRTEESKVLPRGVLSLYFDQEEEAVEPPAKRAKLELSAKDDTPKFRLRHIILKFVGVRNATDPVRRKPITRTQDEAEKKIREILLEILETPSKFPALARQYSECQSALKGGDQAGDLGWNRRGKMNKQFDAAAFALAVNQISDICVTESGVHIIQRLA